MSWNVFKKVILNHPQRICACFLVVFMLFVAPAMAQEFTQKALSDSIPGPLSWQIVMSPGESWETDGLGVHMPWIIDDSGIYKMWYRVAQPTSAGSAGGKIAYATSEDGVNWQGKQLLLESGASMGPERSLRRPVVLKVGSEYRLYNTQYFLGSGWSLFVTLRTCSDGVSWGSWSSVLDFAGMQAWEYDSFNVRAVFPDPGGGYRMFYCVRFSTTVSPDKYWATATSTDGTNWTSRSQLLGLDGQPLFVEKNHYYYTFDLTPAGVYRCLYSNGSSALQVTTSTDGIHWDRGSGGYLGVQNLNTVLSSPPAGAYGGCVVRDASDVEYLYFWPQVSTYRIARALLASPVEEWEEY